MRRWRSPTKRSPTATVPSGQYDEQLRTFRYAPLSSGLDAICKTLGEHGISILQSITIDQDSRVTFLSFHAFLLPRPDQFESNPERDLLRVVAADIRGLYLAHTRESTVSI